MRKCHRIWLALACLSLAPGIGYAADEKDETASEIEAVEQLRQALPVDYQQPDTVFEAVRLSSTGVIAVDTFGNSWQYDFRSAVFIPYQPVIRDDLPFSEPVADRCTEQLTPDAFSREVLVGYNEFVETDIIALGRVIVNGWVQGSVTSINGKVLVNRSGQVDGNIRAPEIEISSGGVVSGEQTVTTPFQVPVSLLEGNLIWIVMGTGLLILLTGFLIVSLMPTQLRTLGDCIHRYRWRTFLLGLASMVILFPVVITVSIVSIVGLVITPLIPLAYFFGMCMGFVKSGNRLGHHLLSRIGVREPALASASFVGLSLLTIAWVLSVWLSQAAGPMIQAIGTILLVLIALYTALPLFTGLGASLLTRFGFRQYIGLQEQQIHAQSAPAPAPPPIPETPPSIPGVRSGRISSPINVSPTLFSPEKNQPLSATPPSETDSSSLPESDPENREQTQ